LWVSLYVLIGRKHSVVVFQRSRLSTLKAITDKKVPTFACS
jgi:hypothetical protein